MDGTLRVLDVQEKAVGAVRPPSFPTPRPAGFPQPKKRSAFASSFKQQRQQAAAAADASGAVAGVPKAPTALGADGGSAAGAGEKANIDRENRERLRGMGAEEIAEARQELLSNLDPALLQILLRRANLDEAGSASVLPGDEPAEATAKPTAETTTETTAETTAKQETQNEAESKTDRPGKTVRFASVADEEDADVAADAAADADADAPPPVPPADLAPITAPKTDRHHGHDHDHDHNHDASAPASAAAGAAMHFPHAPAVPDLDPADPDFLEHLHAKYFPSLPADPARLAWMAPLPTADSPADRDSPYYPGQDSIAVSQLRFDFRGRLVPPRVARTIPVTKGLHHHGVAPEAAGYTVAELARLARSAVPAQRCVAFQTLGRILYRLGRGEWGAETGTTTGTGTGTGTGAHAHHRDSPLAQGIAQSMREGRVLDTLREAASVEEGRGHRGSRAYAIEAIWLLEKGGWKEQLNGR